MGTAPRASTLTTASYSWPLWGTASELGFRPSTVYVIVGKPVTGSSSVSGWPNGLMLLAADAGAVVATPMPIVIAMAATISVDFFIVHPCVVAMPNWRGSASGTHRATVKTQQHRSVGFTVRPPLPFRLGQTVADHTQ